MTSDAIITIFERAQRLNWAAPDPDTAIVTLWTERIPGMSSPDEIACTVHDHRDYPTHYLVVRPPNVDPRRFSIEATFRLALRELERRAHAR